MLATTSSFLSASAADCCILPDGEGGASSDRCQVHFSSVSLGQPEMPPPHLKCPLAFPTRLAPQKLSVPCEMRANETENFVKFDHFILQIVFLVKQAGNGPSRRPLKVQKVKFLNM